MNIANMIALAVMIGAVGEWQGDRPPKPRDKSEDGDTGVLAGENAQGDEKRYERISDAHVSSPPAKIAGDGVEGARGARGRAHRCAERYGTHDGRQQDQDGGSRTKITVGASEERNTGAPADPELEVTSFRHVASTCGI